VLEGVGFGEGASIGGGGDCRAWAGVLARGGRS
jgi:hypothetical protein